MQACQYRMSGTMWLQEQGLEILHHGYYNCNSSMAGVQSTFPAPDLRPLHTSLDFSYTKAGPPSDGSPVQGYGPVGVPRPGYGNVESCQHCTALPEPTAWYILEMNQPNGIWTYLRT